MVETGTALIRTMLVSSSYGTGCLVITTVSIRYTNFIKFDKIIEMYAIYCLFGYSKLYKITLLLLNNDYMVLFVTEGLSN